MVIVWGSIEAKAAHRDELLRISLEHVHRSRKEPGCIRHSVHVDVEHENRLVFNEEWNDMAALLDHFAVPESVTFVERARELSDSPPSIRIFEATETG